MCVIDFWFSVLSQQSGWQVNLTWNKTSWCISNATDFKWQTFLWCISAGAVCRYSTVDEFLLHCIFRPSCHSLCNPVHQNSWRVSLLFADGGVLMTSSACKLVSTSNWSCRPRWRILSISRSLLQCRLQKNVTQLQSGFFCLDFKRKRELNLIYYLSIDNSNFFYVHELLVVTMTLIL